MQQHLQKRGVKEEFHSVESCGFGLESDSEKTFYDSGSEKEFYDKHSPNLWAKCICNSKDMDLLTPPTSPQHDAYSSDNFEDVLAEAISHVDDETLTQTFMNSDWFTDLEMDSESLTSNLIKDCMWSGPGLAAAGFGVTSLLGKKSRSVDENSNTIVDKKSNSDIKRTDCVDPAVVFPHGLNFRNTSPTPSNCVSNSDDWISGLETPSASESDDEEIDVVGVTDKSAQKNSSVASIKPRSSPALNSSIKSRPAAIQVVNSTNSVASNNLPATTSVSAQVAALHNYSSTTHSSKAHSCLKNSLSAPHTPSTHGHSSHSLKRSRPFSSSPASPQSCKKQRLHHHSNDKHRLIANEKDLHSVVRKLNHSGRKSKSYMDSHSYSRSSSDNEDMTETGKRAYHNVLERKRRDDLRLSFHMLRMVVPEIQNNERSPKMVILNTSTEYVTEVTRQNLALNAELQKQKQYHEQLKRKLASLRREAY